MANDIALHDEALLIKKHVDPAAVAAAAQQPTAEEVTAHEATITELRSKLPNVLFGDKPKDPAAEEAAKAAKAKADADAAAAKIAATAPAKTAEELAAEAAKTKIKVTKTDPGEIARTVAAEFAKTFAESQRQQQPVAAQPAAIVPEPAKTDEAPAHFSRSDKETFNLFKVLSETEPERYKDKHLEFSQFVTKLAKYKSKWEQENKGDKFDADAADHEDFYSANQPQFESEDLSKARIRLETSKEVDKRLAKQREEYEAKLAEFERKTVGAEVGREAQAAAGRATESFINGLPDAELKTAVTAGADKLKESDPVAFEVVNRVAGDLQRAVVELHSIVNRPGHYNPQNPVHTYISGFVVQQENQIKQLPAAQQVHQGKQFATRAEYAALPAAQRAQYWMLTEPDVVHMLTASASAVAAQTVKQERAKMETMATKYGFTKAAAAASVTPAAAAVAAVPAKPAAVKPASPSSTAGDASAPAGAGKPADNTTAEKKLVSSLF